MKWLAILANVILLAFLCYMLIEQGMPNDDEFYLVILLFTAPILSMWALFISPSESWLGLYFKRKALEEKKKIQELNE